MPLKGTGLATAPEEIDRFDGGIGWIAYPDERIQRASHALAVDGDVWVVDPVDAVGIDDVLADHGDVRGVVVLFDRHERDAAAFARRHDVPVYVPTCVDGVAADFDVPVERFRYELADTGYVVHELLDNRLWQEAILYSEDRDVLVVPEAVGTTEYFTTGIERLGVHPLLRVRPPTALGRFDPERVLVGHGSGVHTDATTALEDALDGARGRAFRLYWETLRSLVSG